MTSQPQTHPSNPNISSSLLLLLSSNKMLNKTYKHKSIKSNRFVTTTVATSFLCLLFFLSLTFFSTQSVDAAVWCPKNSAYLYAETVRMTYVAAETVALDPVLVVVRDLQRNRILAENIEINITFTPHNLRMKKPSPVVTNSYGRAFFNNLVLHWPKAGFHRIVFSACRNSSLTGSMEYEIVPSPTAASLHWMRPLPSRIPQFGVFDVVPMIERLDQAGSRVTASSTEKVTVTAQYADSGPSTPSITIIGASEYFNSEGIAMMTDLQIVAPAHRTVKLTATYDTSITVSHAVTLIACQLSGVPTVVDTDKAHIKFATSTFRNVTVSTGFVLGDAAYCRAGRWEFRARKLDECHAECPILSTIPYNGPLEFTADRVAWVQTSPIHIIGTPTSIEVTHYPKETKVPFMTRLALQVKAYLRDWAGNRVLDLYPDIKAGAAYRATAPATSVQCFAYNNLARHAHYPNGANSIIGAVTNGVASIELVMTRLQGSGLYQFVCNSTVYAWVPLAKTWSPRIVSGGFNITMMAPCQQPPIISSLSGCDVLPKTNDLYKCHSDLTITIHGANLGYSRSRVLLSDVECSWTRHDLDIPDQLITAYCPRSGENHTVTLILSAGYVVTAAQKVNFRSKPIIDSVVGCEEDYFPSTTGCRLDGQSMIEIRGSGFGTYGSRVFLYPPRGSLETTVLEFPIVTHRDSDTLINATGISSNGPSFRLAVQNFLGELTVSNTVTLSFVGGSTKPCPLVSGYYCNRNGACNFDTGKCVCFGTPSVGYWSGTSCTECERGYLGADCKTPCPGFPTICNGRGQCNDGRYGTGNCTCVRGYTGVACELECPGGVSFPCNNNGLCVPNVRTPTCACHKNPTNGFWTGVACDRCQYGYVGSTCKQPCPVNGSLIVCSGGGECKATGTTAVCACRVGLCGTLCELGGAQCGVCPSGHYGENCALTCPLYPNTCNGRGKCGEGIQGSGKCECSTGWASSTCSVECKGGWTNPCSGHGKCDVTTGLCTCNSLYATETCSVACPRGTNNLVCSGNGLCNDGVSGTGKCQCYSGFAGTVCEIECQGGSSSPCSFHGVCQSADGTCVCYNNQTFGYWAGASCNHCTTDYYGQFCNGTCPAKYGVQCATHGQCTYEVKCSCTRTLTAGYWDGQDCASCVRGYWGTECRRQCPGGVCNPCSSNGICSDDVTGDGTCTCFTNSEKGFWRGEKCNQCVSGYYGLKCMTPCPQTGGKVCSARGTCSDGIRGSGTCQCVNNNDAGHWGGAACETCFSGYYGTACKSKCPGFNVLLGIICSGHGTCSDGVSGAGTCQCDSSYGTADCSVRCPVKNSEVCSGHGVCQDGHTRDATCKCYANTGFGMWTRAACDNCLPGWYGAACASRCPIFNNTVCAGHGHCNDGIRGIGNCTCLHGWRGSVCTRECPGGATNPCYGHGMCRDTCHCFHDLNRGYWSGANCTQCAPMYQSPGCKVPCPTSQLTPNEPCSGHGICYDGSCTKCDVGYCGDACELSGFECDSGCPDGYWGAACQNLCPGNGNCNGRGYCSEGKRGTGKCICIPGAWDYDCSKLCAGGIDNPCTGHGTCSQTTGTCSCESGWGRSDCSTECPGGANNVCNRRGTCDTETTLCTCQSGYAGGDCSLICPGGHRFPCTGHGTCHKIDATCACYLSREQGFWNGTRCEGCRPGYFGASCTEHCIHGRTQGLKCICDRYWSGPDCSVPCPGLDAQGYGTPCNGHGNCTWGHEYANGFCRCEDRYYSTACNVRCYPAICAASPYFLKKPACDQQGQCTCQQSAATGYWDRTDLQCTACKASYWGPTCQSQCQCNNRGTCDQVTGQCRCYDSDLLGHYSGANCESCKTGYIGAYCKDKDVKITRVPPMSSVGEVKDRTSKFMLLDTTTGIVYAGGRPTVAANATSNLVLASLDLRGTAQSGYLLGNYVVILTTDLDDHPHPQAVRWVRLYRGLHGGYVATAAFGSVFIVRTGKAFATQRKLQALAISSHVYVAETVEGFVTDDKYVVMSTGQITLLHNEVELATRSFQSYFDEVFSATMTDTNFIAPRQMVLSGMQNGVWRAISITMTSLEYGAVTVLNDHVKPTQCASKHCLAAKRVVCDGTFVIFALRTADGVALLRFRLSDIEKSSKIIEYSEVIASLATTATANITALSLDTITGAGFIAVNVDTSPTVIYKFDLVTLTVYGSVRFQRIGQVNEIVTGLVMNDLARTMYALIPMDLQVNIVPLNLYAIRRVFPNISDTAGSTTVTVQGEGFLNETVLCDFNGTIVDGIYKNNREIHCVSPVGGDERCEGNALEVSIRTGDRFTANEVTLRRVSSPRITRVYTDTKLNTDVMDAYASIAGGERVLLEGFGFQPSPFLSCRFQGPSETQVGLYADRDYVYFDGTQGHLLYQARFLTTSSMECIVPAFSAPSGGPTYLEVSLDGTAFSRSNTLFEVVGPAHTFATYSVDTVARTTTIDITVALSSQEITYIPRLSLAVVDTKKQRLRRLDTAARRIVLSLHKFVPDVSSDVNITTNQECDYGRPIIVAPVLYAPRGEYSNITTYGASEFSGFYFMTPPSGTYTLKFAEIASSVIAPRLEPLNFVFTIGVGEGRYLRICREPNRQMSVVKPKLDRQPILYVEDISGNHVIGEKLATIRVLASVYQEWTETVNDAGEPVTQHGVRSHIVMHNKIDTRIGVEEDGYIVFEDIDMRGVFGSTYNITFTALDSPEIEPVVSRSVTPQWCSNYTARYLAGESVVMYYAYIGTSECFRCPEGGLCDGTDRVRLVLDNYWRPSNDSYRFYSCESPDSGDSCLKSGECKPGYMGPLCSVCKKGYGRAESFCEECPSETRNIVLLTVHALIAFTICSVIIYSALRSSANSLTSILLKMFINHLQISSRLGELGLDYPRSVIATFDIQRQISDIANQQFATLDCAPFSVSYYDRFYGLMAVPFAIVVVYGVLFATYSILTQLFSPRKNKEEMSDGRQRKESSAAERYRPEGENENGNNNEEDKEDPSSAPQKKVELYRVYVRHKFMVACVVVLFLLYPTVLQSASQLWKCDVFVAGNVDTFHQEQYLKDDRSIDCDSESHQHMQIIASLAAGAYGLGTPLLGFLLVKITMRLRGTKFAHRLFSFLVRGYAPEMWWWECVVMLRKATIVAVIVFVENPLLQNYVAMWVITLALVLHTWCQPYDARYPMLYFLELISLMAMTFTLNLSLLFGFSTFARGEDTTGGMVLSIGLIFFHIVVMVIFVLLLIGHSVISARSWFKHRSEMRRQGISDDEAELVYDEKENERAPEQPVEESSSVTVAPNDTEVAPPRKQSFLTKQLESEDVNIRTEIVQRVGLWDAAMAIMNPGDTRVQDIQRKTIEAMRQKRLLRVVQASQELRKNSNANRSKGAGLWHSAAKKAMGRRVIASGQAGNNTTNNNNNNNSSIAALPMVASSTSSSATQSPASAFAAMTWRRASRAIVAGQRSNTTSSNNTSYTQSPTSRISNVSREGSASMTVDVWRRLSRRSVDSVESEGNSGTSPASVPAALSTAFSGTELRPAARTPKSGPVPSRAGMHVTFGSPGAAAPVVVDQPRDSVDMEAVTATAAQEQPSEISEE